MYCSLVCVVLSAFLHFFLLLRQASCPAAPPQGWRGVRGGATEEPPVCRRRPRLTLHGGVQVSARLSNTWFQSLVLFDSGFIP